MISPQTAVIIGIATAATIGLCTIHRGCANHDLKEAITGSVITGTCIVLWWVP